MMEQSAAMSANLHATERAFAEVGHYAGSLIIKGDNRYGGVTILLPPGVDANPVVEAFNKAMDAVRPVGAA